MKKNSFPSQRPKGKKGMVGGCLKYFLILILLVGVVVAGASHLVFRVLPQKDPSGQFTRENIQSILSGETRVYYQDGKTLHGAFFDANHRVYVPYKKIPKNVINALVAAEDSRFFTHNGFDPKGFIRAVYTNLKAGGMVQGGSTLSQQTAKNIFGREERSLKTKFGELLDALRLEEHFSKEEILEFYLNQFYVTGTGRGLSIAAWHFFSKDLSELSLAECAFIAGSVKGPANYDPFNQKTEEGRKRALARGKIRLEYVLSRMVEEGYITKKDADSALSRPLDFRMGQFRFALSSTMDRIEAKLESPFYRHLFDSLKIATWQKAQLKIVTYLDEEADRSASAALQANLADLQMKLGGFTLPKGVRADAPQQVRPGEYLYGSVDSIEMQGAKIRSIRLRFGVLRGMVNKAELDTFAVRHRMSPEIALVKALKKDAVLLVRVLDLKPQQGWIPVRLETEPVVQGALVALDQGKMLAMQGGFHNSGYDRVNQAVRQFGSAWKPLLFAIAFHHGWSYLDSLENEWNVFQNGKSFYFPRPDHTDRALRVSIAWAAAKSENIASVWLLEHLLDKLSQEQLRAVASANGFLANEEESVDEWRLRLRDSLGLVLDDNAKNEIRFAMARNQVVQLLKDEGKSDRAWVLAQMPYGTGVKEAIKEQKKNPERIPMLRYNYLAWRDSVTHRIDAEARGDSLPALDSVIIRSPLTMADFLRVESILRAPEDDADYLLDEKKYFAWPEFRRQLSMHEFMRFARSIGIRQKLAPVQSMPLGTNDVSLLELTTAYQTLFSGKVYRCKDGDWQDACFIQEIQSADGKILFRNSIEERRILDENASSQIAVILRETFESGTAGGGLHEMVVRSQAEIPTVLAIPSAGKTGTTNDYRNVAFFGALPSWDDSISAFHFEIPVVIGSYAGYDDNRPLQSRGIRIAGASGALPQWMELAQGIMDQRKYAEHVDFLDLEALARGMVPWKFLGQQGEIPVDPKSGLPVLPSFSETSTVNIPLLQFEEAQ